MTTKTAKKATSVKDRAPKSFEDKIKDGDYKTKLPYVLGKNDLEARHAYRADRERLEEAYKEDLFAEHGVTNHPKADAVFNLAWDYGHSAGLNEVANYFSEIVTLIKD